MGSSSKKKKEKKSDFQKPKLRVGKSKPAPSNYTDTSFRAKSITVTQQRALTTSARPSSSAAQLSHNLSLLSHRSDAARRDALAHILSAIALAPASAPAALIVPKVAPLLLDSSSSVRGATLAVLRALTTEDVALRAPKLLLYARAGATHLSGEIKDFALDVLSFLLQSAGEETVSCPGGWVKTVGCLVTVLRWSGKSGATNGMGQGVGVVGRDAKLLVKQLGALTSVLEVGLGVTSDKMDKDGIPKRRVFWPPTFPVYHAYQHAMPSWSRPYARLNLFGRPPDSDDARYEDTGERRRVFREKYERDVLAGVGECVRLGGEVGRTAKRLGKVVEEGMADRGK
ncbi:Rix1 complex component [Lineolata rhizophorae]|uniref:Pre-rRNA-processing protein n=1 Tax=Lineolata rhizophorae TaxID=578093 RepID=A0A6A6P3L9_9PEZI|nr:Rix1 complex component [Lineolata rhizophorae]